MLLWIKAHWENVARGFWFFPNLVALGFVGLAFGIVELDRAAGPAGVSGAFDGDASAARSILSTVAGSLITVAGLSFSITIVTLQLVSSQFTPRALRSFLGDRVSQFIAGTFVGIFAYCLLVLRSVRDEAESFAGFVPGLSVTVAIGFGLIGLILLLVFIHRITQLIKLENIAARIAGETIEVIDRIYPDPYGEPVEAPGDEVVRIWEASGSPALVCSRRPGYVRVIALDQLADVDLPRSARMHVVARPGDYVTAASPLMRIWPADAGEPLLDDLCDLFAVQNERDVAQDVAFGLRQLADIALRALSPGVNDPTTAVTCIGYLADAIERLAGRRFPEEVRRFEELDVVAVVRGPDFAALLDEAFVEVGRYARSDARVAGTLLEALEGVADAAAQAGAERRLEKIVHVAENVAEPAIDEALSERDGEFLKTRLERVRTVSPAGAR